MHLARSYHRAAFAIFAVLSLALMTAKAADTEKPPHGQDKPPGPALSPEEAIKKMTVPDGFTRRVGRQRADDRQPRRHDHRRARAVLDHREPRVPAAQDPAPDRTASRCLKTPTHDGRMDKATIFAEGLNIPSGIAVGHGGVWVANCARHSVHARHRRRLKADKQEVVVTGFGRDDTHELPNSLHLGPRRLALRPQWRLQSQRRRAERQEFRLHLRAVPHPPAHARVSAFLRRGRATPGASPGIPKAARSSAPA